MDNTLELGFDRLSAEIFIIFPLSIPRPLFIQLVRLIMPEVKLARRLDNRAKPSDKVLESELPVCPGRLELE